MKDRVAKIAKTIPKTAISKRENAPIEQTKETLLEYLEHDLKMMPIGQLRKAYKHVRKIVAGLD